MIDIFISFDDSEIDLEIESPVAELWSQITQDPQRLEEFSAHILSSIEEFMVLKNCKGSIRRTGLRVGYHPWPNEFAEIMASSPEAAANAAKGKDGR